MTQKQSKSRQVQEKQVQRPAGKDLLATSQRLRKRDYRQGLAKMQVELLRLQEWVQGEGRRLVLTLEGLGPAGKRRTAERIAEGLDQRVCRVVTPDLPSKRERSQWYFQRFVEEFPSAGHMVIFDGAWYHVPAVERALGLITGHEFEDFVRTCAEFERTLLSSGITLAKYWFSATEDLQEQRFRDHIAYLARRKRLGMLERSPVTPAVPVAEVREAVLAASHLAEAPWYVVKADDRRRARLNLICHLLGQVPTRDEASADLGASPGPAVPFANPAAENHPVTVPEVY